MHGDIGLQSLALPPLRARPRPGLSREVACAAAGYHKGNASRVEKRLKGEIEQERKKLAGMNGGHVPARLGHKDARRIIKAELTRVISYVGPNAKGLASQTLRGLGRQVAAGPVQEFLRATERQLDRERKHGVTSPQTVKLRHLALALLDEIAAFQQMPVFPDPHSRPKARRPRQRRKGRRLRRPARATRRSR